MPPHEVYIEPFAGSAAVARLKREAALNVICELDPIALQTARDAGGAARRNRRVGPGQACTFETGEFAGSLDVPAVEVLPADRQPRWIWIAGDGLDLLEHHQFDGCELVYCDPPYMRSTRKSTKDLYRFEWTDHHHSRLLKWAAETKAKVIISGYASVMYREALELIPKPWNCEGFEVMTRRGRATEILWWNFERPAVLHDDRFLGDGFRDRERIRRRQARWIARLQRMDPAERYALLGAVRSLIA